MPLGIEQLVRGVHPKAVRGLFHGKQILSGFKCVDPGKRPRTKRVWQPNVQYQALYSESLKRKIYLHVTTSVLKRIDRAGGLDMYLLTQPVVAHCSIVGAELRGLITEEYLKRRDPLPRKVGPTSMLQIVNERLKAAGLRTPKPRTPATKPAQDRFLDSTTRPWAPVVHVPYESLRPHGRQLRPHTERLTHGHRVSQELREAILVAKRTHSWRIAKRNGLVTTMRGTARNALARRRASDPLRPLVTPYQWLSQVAEEATDPRERRKWAMLQERYQPTVPGMLIDGIFVPAVNPFAGATPVAAKTKTTKAPAVLAVPAQALPAEARPVSSAPARTKKTKVPAMFAAPAEARPAEALPAEALPVSSAPAKTKKTKEPAMFAAPAEDRPAEALPVSSAPAKTKKKKKEPAASAAPTEAPLVSKDALQSWVSSPGGGCYLKAATGAISAARLHNVSISALDAPVATAAAAHAVYQSMRYPQGRKLLRLLKWLDDDWLQKHIVPRTDSNILVLPNQMILRSPTAKSADVALQMRRRFAYKDPAQRRSQRVASRWVPPPELKSGLL